MKKSFFTLLALLACIIYPVRAYEYFTIYFSDGTKSEAFYATDVDSICYSKLSLDSIAYDDWQVQEIYTCDSVYRYPLAQIDSLSFKDVNEDTVAKDIARACGTITPIYNQCSSTYEILKHIPTIKDVEGVEDVWADNQTLFVKIKDWGTISFLYPPDDEPYTSNNSRVLMQPMTRNAEETSENISFHDHGSAQKVCIINQQVNDKGRESKRNAAKEISDMCEEMGLAVIPNNNAAPVFFLNDIYNYDLVFLMTHGSYDERTGLHWIVTGEQIFEDKNWIPGTMVEEMIAEYLFKKKYPNVSANKISLTGIKELRNGDSITVWYTQISNRYISSANRSVNNGRETIIFNTACQSRKGPEPECYNLVLAFLNNGANAYYGYNEVNGVGAQAGTWLCKNLLNGRSVKTAGNGIPQIYCSQKFEYPKNSGNTVNPMLGYNCFYDECLYHPETIDTDQQDTTIKLKGHIRMLNTSEIVCDYKYGFLVADNPDMNNAKDTLVVGKYDSETLYMNWEATLDESILQPNTTYYSRAYMYDGYSYCYGEIKSFTIPDENAEPYCVVKDNVLTFYYDDYKEMRDGKVYDVYEHYQNLRPGWYYNWEIVEVDFDASFANYEPTSTAEWFHLVQNNIKEIHNIDRLKTINVINMSGMFAGCTYINSLDLSHFDTSNVTNMAGMFTNCNNMKSIDISHFNTSNVINMGNMFAGCTHINSLDLSHFDTSNVTNMSWMFCGCKNLKSIDISHFDTSNVIYMDGMFASCESLTTLDVSNFNTGNVTNMRDMFRGCSSLTAIDVSNFNVNKVSYGDTGYMFYGCTQLKTIYACWERTTDLDLFMFRGCDHLVGGAGTKCLQNYGIANQPIYLDSGLWARVDGRNGKIGLFTAK
jgi:surface protein